MLPLSKTTEACFSITAINSLPSYIRGTKIACSYGKQLFRGKLCVPCYHKRNTKIVHNSWLYNCFKSTFDGSDFLNKDWWSFTTSDNSYNLLVHEHNKSGISKIWHLQYGNISSLKIRIDYYLVLKEIVLSALFQPSLHTPSQPKVSL